jgi:hypothetical protein
MFAGFDNIRKFYGLGELSSHDLQFMSTSDFQAYIENITSWAELAKLWTLLNLLHKNAVSVYNNIGRQVEQMGASAPASLVKEVNNQAEFANSASQKISLAASKLNERITSTVGAYVQSSKSYSASMADFARLNYLMNEAALNKNSEAYNKYLSEYEANYKNFQDNILPDLIEKASSTINEGVERVVADTVQAQTQSEPQPEPQPQNKDSELQNNDINEVLTPQISSDGSEYMQLIEDGLSKIISALSEYTADNYNTVYGLHYNVVGIWLPRLKEINSGAYNAYKEKVDLLLPYIYEYKKNFETYSEYGVLPESVKRTAAKQSNVETTTEGQSNEETTTEGNTVLSSKNKRFLGIAAAVVVLYLLIKR